MKYIITENRFKESIEKQLNIELTNLKNMLEDLDEEDYYLHEENFLKSITRTKNIEIDEIIKDEHDWTIYINLYSYVGDFDYDLLIDYFSEVLEPIIGEVIVTVNKVIKV